MSNKLFLLGLISIVLLGSCKKEDEPVNPNPKLIVKIVLNPNQERLGNIGQPVSIPSGNAGQNPDFNAISAHYLELAPGPYTLLGEGEVIYHAQETNAGGDNAIDFDQSNLVNSGEVFLEIPIKDIAPGTYEWVRLSLSYQNYDLIAYHNGTPYDVTLASFVGFNTYITDFVVKDEQVIVNENKLQGFWAFESIAGVVTGQTPPGAITVPNPLFSSSPIPQGSCVVTGEYENPLVITGNETSNITVTMSLSTNKSFEWNDVNGNGKWDVENGANENVVDMGLRGLVPIVN